MKSELPLKSRRFLPTQKILVLVAFISCLIGANGQTPYSVFSNGAPVLTNNTDGLRSEPATPVSFRCRIAGSNDFGPCDTSALAGTGRGLELFAIGDSVLATNHLSSPKQSVAAQTAQARGWQYTNAVDRQYLNQSYFMLGQGYDWSRNFGLGTITLLAGANQMASDLCLTEGGGPCTNITNIHQNLFSSAEVAWLTWVGSLETRKTYGADCTPTSGVWSAQPSRWLPAYARFAGAPGASLSCKCPQATACFVLTTVTNGTAGTFSITVDGAPVACGYPVGAAVCTTRTDDSVTDPSGSTPVGMVATRIGGLAFGDHTVIVSLSPSNTGNVGVVGIVSSNATDARPVVIVDYADRVAHTSALYPQRTDTVVSLANAIQDQDFQILQKDGFQVVPARISCGATVSDAASCWEPNDPSQSSADGTVPNFVGAQHGANAILAALKAAGR